MMGGRESSSKTTNKRVFMTGKARAGLSGALSHVCLPSRRYLYMYLISRVHAWKRASKAVSVFFGYQLPGLHSRWLALRCASATPRGSSPAPRKESCIHYVQALLSIILGCSYSYFCVADWPTFNFIHLWGNRPMEMRKQSETRTKPSTA